MYLYLVAAFLSGCGTWIHPEPDWVRNPKTIYPENQYLAAVGAGATRQAAENAAAANLSRIFEARIESDERMVDTVRETEKDFTRTTDLTTDINILSAQTLINIQHAEAWADRTGRYHAVAYLNRRETGALYLDQVNDRKQQVQALLNHAAETDNLIEQYALLRAAVRIANGNEQLLQQLKVIHPPTAAAAKPDYAIGEIKKTASDIAKRIRVGIVIQGDDTGTISACLQELVTIYGFTAGTPGILTMEGSVAITDTGQRTAGLAFFNYALAVRIMDEEGNVLTTINEKGREAVTSASEATTRCYRTLENAIKTDGVRSLDLYFDSLVDLAR